MTGAWVNLKAFDAVSSNGGVLRFLGGDNEAINDHEPDVGSVALPGCFYSSETRTGIALEPNRSRRVKKGYLYTFTQVRMHPQASLLVGLSRTLAPHSLDEQGLLQLGGEQRIVKYEVVSGIFLPGKNSGWICSLGPVPSETIQDQESVLARFPRASGPLIRISGWDMKNNFHKPVSSFYPAGTSINIGPETENNFFGFMSL
jgi:hypothetical protein